MRWHDKDVKRWSKQFLSSKRMTLIMLEDKIGISHSTLWWCFTHRLADIDFDLYELTMDRLQFNKYNRERKKKCSKAR